MQIRNIIGPMPFDRQGQHATGRECLRACAAGTLVWVPEYEGDDTVEMPLTESQEEEAARYESHC